MKSTICHDVPSPDLLERLKLTSRKKVCHTANHSRLQIDIFENSHIVILCGLAKEIVRHSLTGLDIIIFHDGLFNISYCHYNQ